MVLITVVGCSRRVHRHATCDIVVEELLFAQMHQLYSEPMEKSCQVKDIQHQLHE